MKKFLAMALALLMVCVMLPVTAMAETTLPAADGNGVINANDAALILDIYKYGNNN